MKRSLASEITRLLPVTLSFVGVLAAVAAFVSHWINSQFVVQMTVGIVASAVGALVAYSVIRVKVALSAPTVFISYASPDTEFARKLAKSLSDLPVNVLFDRDEIRVGESLSDRIDQLVEDADYICFVVSTGSQNSKWAAHELKHALERNKRILPVVLEPEAIPTEIAALVYADFSKEFENGVRDLSEVLR